ncbi:MAG: hypothetical protein ACI82Z_001780 [Cellvibrionaceae bacterium]|jgi:hypothetical protein
MLRYPRVCVRLRYIGILVNGSPTATALIILPTVPNPSLSSLSDISMQTAPVNSLSPRKDRINLTSLNLVRGELMAAIEQAAMFVDDFATDRDSTDLLQNSIRTLQQIRGSLELIELHGATELAAELLAVAKSALEVQDDHQDKKLSLLTKGLFILSCYFEYAAHADQGMPSLLLPYINEVRILNRKPVLWESHFADAKTSFRVDAADQAGEIPEGDSLHAMIRRFRHMYQLGLLGLLKEVNVPAACNLMQRAADHLHQLSVGRKSETFWWLLVQALKAFEAEDMSITIERKRFFSQLDREFKKLEKQGVVAFDTVIPDVYLKEMAYYVALADIRDKPFSQIKIDFGFSDLGYNENKRLSETKTLTGPSVSTVSAVAETLKMELRTIKELVEAVFESGGGQIENFDELIASITKICDILDVIGLKVAAKTMAQQLNKLQDWHRSGDKMDSAALIDIANAFVYVESVLGSIEKRNFSDEKLAEINETSQEQIIVTNHLEDAHKIVLEEAESGLIMVKRALSAFVDSNYDRAHINNISKSLNAVRGAMFILVIPRALEVVKSCIKFVDDVLLSESQPAALEHMLDTFADAIICLEYYFDCLKIDKRTSSDMLAVAEESLAALGYSVSYSGDSA